MLVLVNVTVFCSVSVMCEIIHNHDAEDTIHYRSLQNRPLWLYLWNSITLTQTDGLAVIGDPHHLLASADMSALRYWWDWDCDWKQKKGGIKERERKTWGEEEETDWHWRADQHTVALKLNMLKSFLDTNWQPHELQEVSAAGQEIIWHLSHTYITHTHNTHNHF